MTKDFETGALSAIRIDSGDVRRLNWFGLKPKLAWVLGTPLVNPVVRCAAGLLLAREQAQRLPVNKASVTYRLNDGSTIMLLDALKDTVARDIWHGRGKPTQLAEQHKMRAFEQIARTSALCLDIGAYAGFFALVAARANPDLRAIAFEIVPENYLLMVRNVIANDLVERVEPHLLGLAAATGRMTIPRSFGTASLMSSISIGSTFEEGVSIPLAPLDEVLPATGGSVLIKIDVEGFERDVFRGATRFIARNRPNIICEILPGANQSCTLITDMLLPLGYRFFCFEDEGPDEASRVHTREVMRDWLLTCGPLPSKKAIS